MAPSGAVEKPRVHTLCTLGMVSRFQTTTILPQSARTGRKGLETSPQNNCVVLMRLMDAAEACSVDPGQRRTTSLQLYIECNFHLPPLPDKLRELACTLTVITHTTGVGGTTHEGGCGWAWCGMNVTLVLGGGVRGTRSPGTSLSHSEFPVCST